MTRDDLLLLGRPTVHYLGEAIEPLRREGDWIVCYWPRERKRKEWRHWPTQLVIAGNKA